MQLLQLRTFIIFQAIAFLISSTSERNLQEDFPDDEKCEKLGSMLVSHILNKTPLPTEYSDAYRLLSYSGTFIFDVGDYYSCKSLPYAEFYSIGYSFGGFFSVSIGVCYFKDCDETYIKNAFSKILDKFDPSLKDNFEVFAPDKKLSEIKEEKKVGFIITLTILGVLFILCLVSTLIKFKPLDGFNFEKSARSIFNIKNPTRSYEYLRVFDGVRFLSAGWIVFGHLVMFPLINFSKNITDLLVVPKKWYFPIVLGAYYSVDVFFFLSGFTFYLGSKKYFDKKISRIKMIGANILIRYLRLLPFLIVVTKGIDFVLPYLASGPLGYKADLYNGKGCSKHSWHNFLYINNLVRYKDGDAMCAGQTWYIACDMQFFLISVFIIFPFNNMPIVRHIIFGTIFVGASIAQMIVCYIYKFKYNAFLDRGGEGDEKANFFNDFYISPYARIPPYIMGIYFSILFMETPLYKRDEKDRLSKASTLKEEESNSTKFIAKDPDSSNETNSLIKEENSILYKLNIYLINNNIACMIIFIFSIISINYAFWISNVTNKYENIHILWHAFFNTFNKVFFIGGVGAILHLTFLGKFKFVKGFLTLPFMTRVSRSTYGIYMIHIYIIYLFMACYPNYYYINLTDFFLLAVGTYVVCWILAFALGIMIESPVINISKQYLRG